MTRLFSRSVTIVVVLASILLAECIGQALFCWRNPAHQTLFSISWTSHQLFERHPYLSIKGRPNVHVLNNGTLIAHNSFGYRGPDPTRIPRASRVTIAALGGSSTYCVSLSEPDTWPARLAHQLGPDTEVLNLGIPGYSTAENLIQTAFELPELHPSVALYYEGWNDVRSAHVPNLDPYYADFHGRLQPTNVRLAGPHGYYSALWYGCSVIAARLFASQPFSPADSSIDVPALDLFDRNLRAIVAIDRGFQIEPVLIPQAANCAALRDVSFGTPWIPFVPEREQCAVLAAYNDRMLTIGRELGVTVVTAVAVPDAFSMDDFNDLVHFNQKGARKFSELVAPVVRQMLSR